MNQRQLGYCTNVHAGADLQQTQDNLQKHAVAVKQRFCPHEPMGVGLWLSARTAENLLSEKRLDTFANWLEESGLLPFTLNGFPFGDFHQAVVKHRVYEPTWWEPARLDYTLRLIQILDGILPKGLEGSISTLPISWGQPMPADDLMTAAARQLQLVAEELEQLEQRSGRLIYVCIEPEPGCVIQRSEDIVQFFDRHLNGPDQERCRRYLRVCHDVCHAVVMFEPQQDVLRRYHDAGILIGKVQVSSAVCAGFESLVPEQRPVAVEQLSQFAEDRYLHQTAWQKDDGTVELIEDLPLALETAGEAELARPWRIHFHVPIYLERFGMLHTSRGDILECLRGLPQTSQVCHFEVETYAWGVLPESLQQPELAAGIAEELSWFLELQASAATGDSKPEA